MRDWLLLVAAFLLWPGCTSQNAPCSITRQQLAAKNLFVFGNQRKAQLIKSNHSLQFQCDEGYVLMVPSVRKCVDGYMDLPLCISAERGKNCSDPPRIENGDITTLSDKQYRSGSSVEFRCQKYYAMEGQNRSFCDNGTWTKVPICLDPCMIPRTELESQKVEVKDEIDTPENIFVHHGHSIELTCTTGYALAANSSQSAFVIHCDGTPPEIPKCKKISCNSPRISNGTFRPQRTIYHDGDLIRIQCDSGFTFEPDNGEKVVECTKNGWSPPPKCIKNLCPPPEVAHGYFLPKQANYTYNDEIETICDEGFVFGGPGKVSKCTTSGWNPPTVCKKKRCDYVNIENGMIENHYEQFPKWEGETIQFYCNYGFLPISKQPTWQTATCINSHFEPELKCFKTCDPTQYFSDGHFTYNYWLMTYIEGDNITFVCNKGYSPANQQSTISCTTKGWSPAPKCIKPDVRCSPPPEIQNAQIIGEIKAKYSPHEKVQYRCNTGYALLGNSFITCLKKGWTQIPRCTVVEGRCGRPPPVENGDIVDTPKLIYLDSESVIYQCQSFYTMEGSPRVTCQNGDWSQTPTCRVACTASAEDMREHNIRLKWNNGDKIYSTDGNVAEFECLRGYEPHPNTRSLRVNCVDGKFNYPHCIPV